MEIGITSLQIYLHKVPNAKSPFARLFSLSSSQCSWALWRGFALHPENLDPASGSILHTVHPICWRGPRALVNSVVAFLGASSNQTVQLKSGLFRVMHKASLAYDEFVPGVLATEQATYLAQVKWVKSPQGTSWVKKKKKT